MGIDVMIWLSEISETNPQLYGEIVGFCLGFAVAMLLCGAMAIIELHTKKKERKMSQAVDLLGEDVIYSTKTLKIEGQVVSVDYDLEESGLITTVYIDVVGMDKYYKVDFSQFGKNLVLKGADNEQK